MDLKVHPAPNPCTARAATHQIGLPRALSNLGLNASKNGTPTASLGRETGSHYWPESLKEELRTALLK